MKMTRTPTKRKAPTKTISTHQHNISQQSLQAPAKRSQHFEAKYRNMVGRDMLHTFGHQVVTCCDMLGVVAQIFKMIKIFRQHLQMLHDVVVVWPGSSRFMQQSCAGACALVRFSTRNRMPQHVATYAGQTHTTCYAQQCCDMSSRNFAIVWPELAKIGPTMLHGIFYANVLRLFGRGLAL